MVKSQIQHISSLFTFLALILIIVSCNPHQTSRNQPSEALTNGFVPDDSVKQLALEMDRKHFPVFLNALKKIEESDFDFLVEYYDGATLNPSMGGKKEIRIDTLRPKVSYYYKFNAEASKNNPLIADGYKIEFPVDWKANINNDRSWSLWFQSLRWMQDYLVTDDQDTILTGLKIIQDMIMSNLSYPSENGEFIFDDMGIGFRLNTFTLALKKYNSLNISDSVFHRQLLSGILAYVSFMSSLERYNSWHNHGIYMDQALLQSVSELDGLLEREEIQNLASRRVAEQFRYSYTEDGIHKEHTPAYHIYITRELENFLEFVQDNRLNIPGDLEYTLKKAREYYPYLRRPNHLIPPIGDNRSVDFSSFVKINDTALGEIQSPVKVFPNTHWVFFNSRGKVPINAIIQADFFSRSHYQEDETSFIITAGDHELIIDPGIHSYNKDNPFVNYMRKARAHNVLLVDKQDYKIKVSNTGLSGLTRYVVNDDPDIEWKGAVEMTHPHYDRELGVKIYRQFGQVNDSSFVIRDITQADSTHLYSRVFHFAPEATIEPVDENTFTVSWPHHGISIWMRSDYETYEVVEGALDPAQGWYFPAPLTAVPQPVLYLNVSGSSREMITYLVITSSGNMMETDKLQTIAGEMFDSLELSTRKNLEKQPQPKKWRPQRKA